MTIFCSMSVYIFDTIIFILSVLLISCSAVPTTTVNDPSKQVPDLVDLLKQDLRRNNDDYIEMTATTNSKTSTKPNISPASLNVTFATNQDKNQGNVDKNQGPANGNKLVKGAQHRRNIEEEDNDNGQSNAENDSAPMNIGEDLSVHTEDPADKIIKTSKSVTETPTKKQNEEKGHLALRGSKQEKFRNFVETNQKLFNEFLNKKQSEAHMKLIQSRSKVSTVKYGGAEQKGQPVMRARYDTVVNPAYNERQLDMAPAKGGRIHSMRIKGRLCQRNVLLPEGPKYDSQGKAYLGAYQANGGRDYSHTRRPKLVLPRCCNCCKKSVLGCE